MHHMTVEQLNVRHADAVLALLNAAYADVDGFTPVTQANFNALEKSGFFSVARINEQCIGCAYAAVEKEGRGVIRWVCVAKGFRGKCHSIPLIQVCIDHLKAQSVQAIRVANWLDAPYRPGVSYFESKAIPFEHDQLVMRLDMRKYTPQPPVIKTGYTIRHFREGDEKTWAKVQNTIFDSSSTPKDFWQQGFLGVNKHADFDESGFFFPEKDGEAVGICAGLILHDRVKINGTFPGGIGWTGVIEAHRGSGLGRALMVSSLNYLADKGIAMTEVGTQFYRTTAVNLYEGLGFCIHRASFDLFDPG